MIIYFAKRGWKRVDQWSRAVGMLLFFVLGQSATGQLISRPLSHNGCDRPYLVYRPSKCSPHPAIVVMLAGIRSTAQYAAENFGWEKLAEQYHFLAVFPEPVRTYPGRGPDRSANVTFWEMQGSRTHVIPSGGMPVDDDGYLTAVLRDVTSRDHPDGHRIYMAGFSSGSAMVQLFASSHPEKVDGIVAVATPLMAPPVRLTRPVAVLYIHGDDDEQLSGFEIHSPDFATTPHGNWVTWGYLDGCKQQTAERMAWGVRYAWKGCKDNVPVVGNMVEHLAHEWTSGVDAH
jgi:polyhydroxybutyrate depolymerase